MIEEAAPEQQVIIIWHALLQTETELEKREPESALLKDAAKRLLKVASAITHYSGTLADTALKSAAKTLGAGIVGVAVLPHMPHKEAIIELAKSLLRFIAH